MIQLSQIKKLEQAAAVQQLTGRADATHYSSTLTEFWESWITNEVNDGADALERSEKLEVYKGLMEFLGSINTPC